MANSDSLAVIIPMYNEEKVADRCIDDVFKYLNKLTNKNCLIVVNDGSIDDTSIILDQKLKKYKKLIVVSHSKNKGYGAATQSGTNEAIRRGYKWGLHMDSDLTNDPKYIKSFISATKYGADCIKASRYIKGGKVKNVPSYRNIVSYVGNALASRLFNVGIKDCTNGFRLIKLSYMKNAKLKENNFSIILEELYYLKKNGAKFSEIPYILTARNDSKSHFSYKPKVFVDYFKYAIRAFRIN